MQNADDDGGGGEGNINFQKLCVSRFVFIILINDD